MFNFLKKNLVGFGIFIFLILIFCFTVFAREIDLDDIVVSYSVDDIDYDDGDGGVSIGEIIPTPTDYPKPVFSKPTPEPTTEPTLESIDLDDIEEDSFQSELLMRLDSIQSCILSLSENQVVANGRLENIRDNSKTIRSVDQNIYYSLDELSKAYSNDINNSDMLSQLSSNINELNDSLSELSTFLGYIYAFLIFVIIVIVFKGCWYLIDKYLLNVTLR